MLPNLSWAHGFYRMLVRLVRAAFASAVTFHGHLVLVCEPRFLHHQTKSRQIPQTHKTNKRVKIQPLSSVPGGNLCHRKRGLPPPLVSEDSMPGNADDAIHRASSSQDLWTSPSVIFVQVDGLFSAQYLKNYFYKVNCVL